MRDKAITHPDFTTLLRIADSIYPEFYGKIGGMESVDRIQKIGEEVK
jgi:hypothetical protein